MNFMTILMIALGVSMDAFAVSLANGIANNKLSLKKTLISCSLFGLMQGLMPLMGYTFSILFARALDAVDHYIVFVILTILGVRMIQNACKKGQGEGDKEEKITYKRIVIQAVATSLDAFVTGVSFAAMRVNLWLVVSVNCVVTFLVCLLGVKLGKRCCVFLDRKAGIFGGLMLIFIGSRILTEHLFGR